MDALSRGWADFTAMPSHAVFLCVVYPLIGLLLAGLTLGQALVPLVFPIAAGFALVGPIAALGLYELSRRREAGLAVSASDAFDVLRSPSIGAIVALGLGLTAWFMIWIAVANAIYVSSFGYGSPASIEQFLRDLFTTSAGWKLILVGNETGMGIVPLGELTRRYCDAAGRLHQDIAARCGRVLLTVAGLPLALKGDLP